MRFFLLLILFSLISCKSTKKKDANPVESAFSENMIELNLADKMNPLRIETSFKSLGVKYLCTVDKSSNKCIYSFDLEQNSFEYMLEFLRNEVGVEDAAKTTGCDATQ